MQGIKSFFPVTIPDYREYRQVTGKDQEDNMLNEINNPLSGDTINQIVEDIIGVNKDSTNRIGQQHLKDIILCVHSRAPIKKSTLVSILRVKILIGERYVNEYLDGLEALEIIKLDKNMILWNFNDTIKPAEIPTKQPLNNHFKPDKNEFKTIIKDASKQIYDQREELKIKADSAEGIPFEEMLKLTPFSELGMNQEQFETWVLTQIEG
ncbi:MAG: hypothetical protein WA102_06825 [Candidatus Methanoperedens sp.]